MKLNIFILLAFVVMVNKSSALTILKPTEGDTYTVGQKLTIELQVLPEDQVQSVVIQTKDFDGNILDSSPYIYETTINKPIDGQEPIGVMVHRRNMKPIILKSYIYVKLPSEIEVKDIMLESGLLTAIIRPDTNGSRLIEAYGIDSGGKKYPLRYFPQVNYQSLNEAIATVDLNGIITGIFPGKTKVTISAGNVIREVNVVVEYEIDPIKGITATALEKTNEIKWEKSPYEGDIVSEYRVYRAKDSDGMGKKMIGTVAPGTYTFTDTQPVAGVKYYYSVQAFSQKYNTGSDMESWVSPVAVPPTSN